VYPIDEGARYADRKSGDPSRGGEPGGRNLHPGNIREASSASAEKGATLSDAFTTKRFPRANMNKKVKFGVVGLLLVMVVIVVVKIMGRDSPADTRRQNTPLVQVEQPHNETVTYKLKFTGDV